MSSKVGPSTKRAVLSTNATTNSFEYVGIVKEVHNHGHRVPLCNAVLQRDGLGQVVIKSELRASAGECRVYDLDKRLGDPTFPHVVKELVLHRIWEGAFDVEKEYRGDTPIRQACLIL